MNLTELIIDLESVRERLDSTMFESLREAAATKSGRPATDKELMKVQRAIDKAINTLRLIED